ncbi:MAG: hypothetical protein ABW026_07085 [Microvirga sp.]|nr:hypothetical protein [Methylobacterium sp. E-066]MCJ2142087.1 hypothetical protein [Methylobacterium sp. E-066]
MALWHAVPVRRGLPRPSRRTCEQTLAALPDR